MSCCRILRGNDAGRKSAAFITADARTRRVASGGIGIGGQRWSAHNCAFSPALRFVSALSLSPTTIRPNCQKLRWCGTVFDAISLSLLSSGVLPPKCGLNREAGKRTELFLSAFSFFSTEFVRVRHPTSVRLCESRVKAAIIIHAA